MKSTQNGGDATIKAPSYIIIPSIVNVQSQEAITSVLLKSKKYLDDWPGTTYDTDTDEGKVLLSTPNSKAVAFFLITHKAQFGLKKISKITIFKPAMDWGPYPYLGFTIEGV